MTTRRLRQKRQRRLKSSAKERRTTKRRKLSSTEPTPLELNSMLPIEFSEISNEKLKISKKRSIAIMVQVLKRLLS